MKLHNFFFLGCVLKTHFDTLGWIPALAHLMLKSQWEFRVEFLLWFLVSSLARPMAKVNTCISWYDKNFMLLGDCLLIDYAFIPWQSHELLLSDSWRLIQVDEQLYHLIVIRPELAKNPTYWNVLIFGPFSFLSFSTYFRNISTKSFVLDNYTEIRLQKWETEGEKGKLKH